MTAWEHHVPLAFHSEREADHSPPSSAEVKERVELYFHSSYTPSWRGAQLKDRDIIKIYLVYKYTDNVSLIQCQLLYQNQPYLRQRTASNIEVL